MPELSIVIPVLILDQEGIDLTQAALHSLREALQGVESEFIIVDDGSPVGGGYLREEADIYIRHKVNEGYHHAVNDGLRIASGDYVVVPNNDIRVAPNFFEVAKEILKDREVYSVHPKMIPYDEPFSYGDLVAKTGKERWCQTSFFIVRKRNNDSSYMAAYSFDGIPFNNGLFLFDENMKGTGGAYEDWLLWTDVRRTWKTAYTNQTAFQHLDSSTTKKLGEQSKFHEENKEYFKKRWGSYPEEHFAQKYPDQLKVPWRPFP